MWAAFEPLIAKGQQLLKNNTSHEQVVIVLMANGNILHCLNRSVGMRSGSEYDTADEAQFLELLRREGCPIHHIAALWNPNVVGVIPQDAPALDVPGYHLRKGLLDLHPTNQEALILLRGERGYNVRPLKTLF